MAGPDLQRRIARLRVPLGFAFGILAIWFAMPGPRSLVYGGVIVSVGEAIRVWAAGHLDKGREVTSSGPYALTRHPLYLGTALIGAGFAVACASEVVAAIVSAYLVVTLTAAIRTEEAELTAKFGVQYPAYRDGRVAVAGRRFSLDRVMRNREYRAVGGLLFVLALLAWKAYS